MLREIKTVYLMDFKNTLNIPLDINENFSECLNLKFSFLSLA